jgi:hypothetical protein
MTRYYVVSDPDNVPLCLLRRVARRDGVVDEALRRDLRWHPTDRFAVNARNGEYEIEEIPAERADAIADRWRAAWLAR